MKNLKAKLRRDGGFTLVEMLIVVAIIAILIAVSIPMVAASLDKARQATDDANKRAALGMAMVEVMTNNKLGGQTLAASPTTTTAAYKVTEGKGELVASGTAKAAGFNYGQSSNYKEGYVKITYTPATTTAEAKFEAEWITS